MHASDLTPAQQFALVQFLHGKAVRVKELLELESLGIVKRISPSPRLLSDWELTDEGRAVSEEISR